MTQIITILGNSQALSASTTASNIAFLNCPTSAFEITNAGSSGDYVYVGITNTPITTFHHPTAGGAGGLGKILPPNASVVMSGNFKANIDSNVYVYAITALGTASVFATPVIGF